MRDHDTTIACATIDPLVELFSSDEELCISTQITQVVPYSMHQPPFRDYSTCTPDIAHRWTASYGPMLDVVTMPFAFMQQPLQPREQQPKGSQINVKVVAPSLAAETHLLPPPGNPPTPRDWEAYRAIFTRLYFTEGRKLRDVMAIMEGQHNFHATERMYKRRIDKWKLHKNYKSADRNEIAQIVKFYEIRSEKCPKNITIGGQPVKMHRVRRHCKNPRLSSSQLHALEKVDESFQNEPAFEVELEDFRRRFTLSFKPVPPLQNPPQLHFSEILLSQTDIICESLGKLKIDDDSSSDSESDATEDVQRAPRVDPSYVFGKIDAAFCMLQSIPNQQKAAWRFLGEASDQIGPMLLDNDDWSIGETLFKNIALWMDWVTSTSLKVVVQFIGEMTSTILGCENPLSKVLSSITLVELDTEVYIRALKLMLSKCEQVLGPDDSYTWDLADRYVCLLVYRGQFDEAENVIRKILENSERDGSERDDKYSYYSLWFLHRLGWTFGEKGDLFESEVIYQDALLRCRTRRGERFPKEQEDYYVIAGLRHTLHGQGKFAECEHLLLDTVEKCSRKGSWGPDDWKTVRLLGYLNRCLLLQGKIEESGRLRGNYPDAFDF